MGSETQLLESLAPYSLPLFFTWFLSIYLLARFVVFRSWSPSTRPEASSCLISLFHGTPAVAFSALSLLADPAPSFSSPNTLPENLTLEYSVAYFFMDLAHYLVFSPGDGALFIAHHVATLFVFLTCRYAVARGACAILGLLILAEVTSLCQNAWTLANARRADSEVARRVYDALSPPFYVFYSIVRGSVGPYFVWRMGAHYYREQHVIPTWLWASWMVVVVMAISVSLLWIANLWAALVEERRGKLGKKKMG